MATVANGPSPARPTGGAVSPHDLVDDGSGRTRARLVADPALAELFRLDPPPNRRRRGAGRLSAPVVVGVALVAALAVFAVRHAAAPDSTAPSAASPAPAGPSAAAGAVLSPPGAAPTAGTSAGVPAAADAPAPLTRVANPDDEAGGPLRSAAAVGLAANADVRLSPQAREALLSGLVDVRLTTVLATLAAQVPLGIEGFSAVGGDPAAAPLRQVVVKTVDPASLAAFDQALADQAGNFAMQVVADGSDGQLVRLVTAGPQ